MNDDKHSLNGMPTVDIWKQKESEKGDAIIAVDENGNVHITVLLTQDPHKFDVFLLFSLLLFLVCFRTWNITKRD